MSCYNGHICHNSDLWKSPKFKFKISLLCWPSSSERPYSPSVISISPFELNHLLSHPPLIPHFPHPAGGLRLYVTPSNLIVPLPSNHLLNRHPILHHRQMYRVPPYHCHRLPQQHLHWQR